VTANDFKIMANEIATAVELISSGSVKRLELTNGVTVYHIPTKDGTGTIRIDIKCIAE